MSVIFAEESFVAVFTDLNVSSVVSEGTLQESLVAELDLILVVPGQDEITVLVPQALLPLCKSLRLAKIECSSAKVGVELLDLSI